MKKNVINEREMTQRMLQTINKTKNLIKENEEMQNPAEAMQQEVNKVEASESDVAEAQEKFRQNVAPDAQFKEYTIQPDQGNVVFSGSVPGLGDWIFEYTQKEGYAFQTDTQITMTDTNFEVLKKMFGYFINWREEMSEKLLEYKQSNG
jgi:hypothetical protein